MRMIGKHIIEMFSFLFKYLYLDKLALAFIHEPASLKIRILCSLFPPENLTNKNGKTPKIIGRCKKQKILHVKRK